MDGMIIKHMSDQFEELINRHLRGELTEEEAKMLGTLLKQPEKQLYLASRIDQDFSVSPMTNAEADEQTGQIIFSAIKQKILEEKAFSRIKVTEEEAGGKLVWMNRKKLYRITAIAATITIVLFAVIFWNKNKNESIGQRDTIVEIKPTEQRRFNNTGKEQRIEMTDGSLVVLADKSEIVYREPFRNNRNIQLTGKAYFKVFKDSSSAFTVISGDISTTALGTEFTVTTFKDTRQVVVRLYEGRVVVRPLDKLNKNMKKDIYLLPGQEFIYGKENAARNRSYRKGALPEQSLNEEKFLDDPTIPDSYKGAWYMFNNQLLSQTLDQLAVLYNTKIIYNKEDVKNVYFTGKYERTDSVATILQRIGTINNLKISKNDTAFIITK